MSFIYGMSKFAWDADGDKMELPSAPQQAHEPIEEPEVLVEEDLGDDIDSDLIDATIVSLEHFLMKHDELMVKGYINRGFVLEAYDGHMEECSTNPRMFTTNESKVGYEIALEGFAGTAWKYLQAGIKALVDLITKLINWLFFGSRGNKKQSERDYKAYSNELSNKIEDVASDIESLKRDYEAAVKDLDDEKQKSETYKDLHEKTKKLLDQERLENQPALTNEFTGIKDKNPNFTWYVNKYYEEQQANSKQGLPMDVRDLLEGRNPMAISIVDKRGYVQHAFGSVKHFGALRAFLDDKVKILIGLVNPPPGMEDDAATLEFSEGWKIYLDEKLEINVNGNIYYDKEWLLQIQTLRNELTVHNKPRKLNFGQLYDSVLNQSGLVNVGKLVTEFTYYGTEFFRLSELVEKLLEEAKDKHGTTSEKKAMVAAVFKHTTFLLNLAKEAAKSLRSFILEYLKLTYSVLKLGRMIFKTYWREYYKGYDVGPRGPLARFMNNNDRAMAKLDDVIKQLSSMNTK